MMPLTDPGSETALEELADHCLAAKALIARTGTPVMSRLIDVLLFEIGRALAEAPGARDGGGGESVGRA